MIVLILISLAYLLICLGMVRNYVKKTNRGSWTLDSVAVAANAVKNGEMSLREAEAKFGVPKSTLERHKNNKIVTPGSLGRFTPVLDADFEKDLVEYCIIMQQRLFGLSLTHLRSLAFDLAEKNNISNDFNKTKRLAGRDWAHQFLRRNPQLSLRTPEPTSLARAVGFNRVQIGRFFDILKTEYTKNEFDASRIWNVDETGITNVHSFSKSSKVISVKGQKQVGKITSGEKGKTFTVLCTVNAAGSFLPPMIIFPRVNMTQRLLVGAPPCTVGVASKSGWVDQDLFLKWLTHFISHVKPSPDVPHLLLLDGHVSHKSLAVIDLARQNGVVMITFPPHSTHKLQPLDCVMYGPLKTYYKQECDKWMLSNPGKRISDYDVAGIFSAAYTRAATMDKGINGFACTGIFPFNPHVFEDNDFAPSLTTEIVTTTVVSVPTNETSDIILPEPEPGRSMEIVLQIDANNVTNDIPATSGFNEDNIEVEEFEEVVESTASDEQMHDPVVAVSDLGTSATLEVVSSSPVTSPVRIHAVDISPFPTCFRTEQRKRKSQASEVITGSPYKKMLEAKLNTFSEKQQCRKKGTKRNPPKVSAAASKEPAKRKNMKAKFSTDKDTTPCGTCAIRYCDDKTPRSWIQCQCCSIWYHNECQGLDERVPKTFKCILCENAN